jgi:3-methylcrotonyl-CoA carboxylase alpha subunit
LFERECSLQRRFQKIIEEAPASNLSADLRELIIADAVKLARRVDYRNLGTIEFLVSADRHYFLECNPRLQVEHTVTEAVTGLDLVELQLEIAVSGVLPISQEQICVDGHAIQARVYAEDSAAGFIPSTGLLQRVDLPFREVRVETAVETGSEITPHYDSMIAKLIAHGATRAQALDRLLAAVEHTVVFGVETNLGFLARLLTHPVVRAGTADNRFIDREMTQAVAAAHPERDSVAVAAALLLAQWNKAESGDNTGLWGGGGDLLGWHYSDGTELVYSLPAFSLTDADGRAWPVAVGRMTLDGLVLSVDGQVVTVRAQPLADGRHQVMLDQLIFTIVASVHDTSVQIQGPFGAFAFTVVPFLSLEAAAGSLSGQVLAPMMGVIAKVNVRDGDSVNVGDMLVVQESMKMELVIEAPCSGTVVVACAEGEMVERHQVLVEINPCD